jgi:hypothetical protein
MKAITRIWPPQTGHSSSNTSQMRAISTAHRMCAGRQYSVGWVRSGKKIEWGNMRDHCDKSLYQSHSTLAP